MFSCLEMCGKERIGIVWKYIALYNRNLPNGSLKRLGREYKYKLLEIIKNRLKEYNDKTIPVIDFFKSQNKYFAINGLHTIKLVV